MEPLNYLRINKKLGELLKIETVKGNLVTLILGAYHLPAKDKAKTTALVM
jgi:hypothetical protein